MENSNITDFDLNQFIYDSPVAYYICNCQGEIIFFNKAAADIWGRTPVKGKDQWCGSWKIFFPDGTPMPPEKHPVSKLLRTGKSPGKKELRIKCPDGTYKFLISITQPLFDIQGKLKGAANTIIDITEQKKDHIKKETLSAIVNSSEDAMVSKDLNGIITSWNKGAERIFGFSESEAIGNSILIIIPEDRREEEEDIISKIKEGKRVEHFETLRLNKSGKTIPISVSISPVKDAFGRVVGASKVARDISERLSGEEKQELLSAIVESSDDAIISKNLNGTIMSWNRGAQEIFGYSESEVFGKSVKMLIPKERLSEEDQILNRIKKGIKIDHFETIRRHKSGRLIPISITVSPLKNSNGTIIGASKVARDITVQYEAQATMEKYIRNLETLNSVGTKISEKLDSQEIINKVTETSTFLVDAQFGTFVYNPGENIEKCRLSTLSTINKQTNKEILQQISPILEEVLFNYRVIRKAGKNNCSDPIDNEIISKEPIDLLGVPVILKSGKVIGGLFFGHSKSDHFSEEHELLVANLAAQAAVLLDHSILFQQVKSLSDKKDEFIALVSHELKTPLTTIKGYNQILAQQEANENSQFILNKSLDQIEKLNSLVEDLLNMSRVESGTLNFKIEKFDLKEMMEEIIETYSYSSLSHKIISNCGDAPIYINGDKQRLEQVVLNLISNAMKYSPNADKIFIDLSLNNNYVSLKVKDKGIGLTPQQQVHLFTRFYRAENSKGISGLGLGLYLAKQIVERHGGELKVVSEYGKGSEFSINLQHLNN